MQRLGDDWPEAAGSVAWRLAWAAKAAWGLMARLPGELHGDLAGNWERIAAAKPTAWTPDERTAQRDDWADGAWSE